MTVAKIVDDANNPLINRVEYDWSDAGQVVEERHTIRDVLNVPTRTYTIEREFTQRGALKRLRLPKSPTNTTSAWGETFSYDAGNRLTGITNWLPSITYNHRSQPTEINYGSDWRETRGWSVTRGWLMLDNVYDDANVLVDSTDYDRNANGSIKRQTTQWSRGRYSYSYDYAGRLLEAEQHNHPGNANYSRTFTYDSASRMRSDSRIGAFDYSTNTGNYIEKDVKFAPNRVNGAKLKYDLNGNMTQGLDGKQLRHNLENDLVLVNFSDVVTRYTYGADGARMKRTETAQDDVVNTRIYFGEVEIRNYGTANEIILTYPHPLVRLTNGVPSWLTVDHLGSTRVETAPDGTLIRKAVYEPGGVSVS